MELLGRLLGDVKASARCAQRQAYCSCCGRAAVCAVHAARLAALPAAMTEDCEWPPADVLCSEHCYCFCRRGAREVSQLLDELVAAADRLATCSDQHMAREEVRVCSWACLPAMSEVDELSTSPAGSLG